MEIEDKIRALLNKAQDTDNEAEAETFFAGAYRLMLKHGIEEGDILVAKDSDPIVRQEILIPGRYGTQKQRFAHTISKHFGVYLLVQSKQQFQNGDYTKRVRVHKLFLYGRRSNIRRMMELTADLWWWGETKYINSPGRRTDGFLASFWDGYSMTISSRLRETIKEVENTESVSLVPALMDARKLGEVTARQMEGGIGHSSYRSQYNASGMNAGRQAGQSANLHSGSINAGGRKQIG